MGEHFCLKWNNHQENLTGIMTKLLDEQKFVDVSLVCENKTFKAHQTVLSACSPYFQQVLEDNSHPHPIIILRDVKECEMAALLQYMYRGEVNVRDHELSTFLHTARALQIRGLSDNKKDQTVVQREDPPQHASPSPQSFTPLAPKRRRISASPSEGSHNDRQILECQQSSLLPIICKTPLPQKPSSIVSTSSYSDNLSEMQYVDTSTPNVPTTIKQEMDGVSTQSEEPFHSVAHSMPERSSYNEVTHGPQPDTPNLSDIGNLNAAVNGSKTWNVKYYFEEVDGCGYKCKLCGQLKKHMRNHFLKHFPEHHVCKHCDRTYTRKDNLNSHLKRDHYRPRPQIGRPSQGQLNILGSTSSSPSPRSSRHIHRPMDLSLRSHTAPLHSQALCTPFYDFLPSLYGYLRN